MSLLQKALYIVLMFNSLILHNTLVQTRTLTMSVKEEMPQNTTVGMVTYLPGNQTIDNTTVLNYSFLPQGYPHTNRFTIDANTGKITTAEVLDREELCGFFPECKLKLEVAIQSTHHQIFQKVKVVVDVVDINDNAPEFPSKSVVLKISESVSVNSTFAIEGAVDKDVGRNALQTYDIIRGEGKFDINIKKNLDGGSVVNLMVIEPLDREIRDFYRVYVMAKDGGIPRKSNLLMLNITVLDVNDNAPDFTSSVYKARVKEVMPPGSVILQVAATDKDSKKFWKPVYRFSTLQAGEFRDYFAINGSTGEIKVISPLTQIQGKTMKFIVECVDGGVPSFVSQTEVHIQVLDTINSPPTINLNVLSEGRISESADVGTVVAHVSAVDPDSGRNGLVKCFVNSDTFEVHALDVNDYKITTTRSLNREERAWYNITVMCEDAGKPTLTTKKYFTLQVEDENDNTPQFSQYTYELNLEENNPVNQLLLQVTATDIDAGINGNINYHIPDGEKYGVSVSSSGEIFAEKSFDREESSQIRFVVVASDGGERPNSASVTVIINLEDVNDFVPTFSQQRFIFSLEEDRPAGASLGKIFPLDLDDGVNGELVMNIELPFYEFDNFPFVITSNGDLLTNSLLDREARSQYVFSVIATDRGDPPLSSSTEIVVNIIDINDNTPVIVSPNSENSSVIIPNHTEPGTAIYSIIAVDNDTESNGHLQYYLTPESDHDLFHLDKESGVVYLKRHLEPADGGVYPLSIMVKDQGVPFRFANASLEITIVADNETFLSVRQRENTTIAIVMGCITGLIAICVVITIIFMRNSDRAWRLKRNSGNSQDNSNSVDGDNKLDSVVVQDAQAANSNVGNDAKKDLSQLSQGWHFLPGVAVDLSTTATRTAQTSMRKRSADSYSSGASGNDSGKGGSDDEICNEDTSSVTENNLQCAENARENQLSRSKLEQAANSQFSDYVHLDITAKLADVTTLSNYSYNCPGWKEPEVTSEQCGTQRRTKHVSFRLEPKPDGNTEQTEQITQNSCHDNSKNAQAQSQKIHTSGLKVGDAILFDLSLQKLNDVIV